MQKENEGNLRLKFCYLCLLSRFDVNINTSRFEINSRELYLNCIIIPKIGNFLLKIRSVFINDPVDAIEIIYLKKGKLRLDQNETPRIKTCIQSQFH